MAEYARSEINRIGGYYAYSRELINGDSIYDFDVTKLSVYTLDTGLAGIEVYDLLRDEYDIQIEFGDLGNILAYLSIGDRPREIERLVSALSEIREKIRAFQNRSDDAGIHQPGGWQFLRRMPFTRKRSLFRWSRQKEESAVNLSCAIRRESRSWLPGERITGPILDYIRYAKEKGCSMTGPERRED